MVGFFIGFLTVVLALVCLLMVFIVLMQKPKQEGLGAAFGGGVTDQMWGADASNILQKITVWLAVMFFVITMLLAVLVGIQQKARINKESITQSTVPENPPGGGSNSSAGLPPSFPPPESTNTATTTPIKITPAAKAEDPAAKTEDPAAKAEDPAAKTGDPPPQVEKDSAATGDETPATEAPAKQPATSTPAPPTP
ncbi:MAG: preprotein translocase subunit SecG [Verrucomicrobiales bacterium]